MQLLIDKLEHRCYYPPTMNRRAYFGEVVKVAPMSGTDTGLLITFVGGARVSQMQ